MKLRIRPAGGGASSTLKVEVPAACSLQGLQDAIIEALESRGIPFSRPLGVSLNKTEPIEGQGSALLSHFGICNGDLLYYFERGAPHSATAGVLPLGNAGNSLSVASVGVDTVSKDVASTRRELCAAAATRRKSSVVHSSMIAVDAEDTKVSVSEDSLRMVDEPGSSLDVAHTSMDMQIDGENLPHDIPTRAVDAGGARHSNSIPVILQRILIAEHRHVSRPSDLLVLAVHAVMLETGFIVVNAMEEGHTLPGGWSNGGSANISYTLPEIRDAENGVGNVVLKSLTLGGNVVFFGTTTPGTLSPLKLSLLTSRHLIGNVLSHDDLISSYSDLFELWKCAKDGLALRLLTTLCEMAGLPAPSSLLVIPTELKMKILEFLPALDLMKVGCTCSELRHISANDELWKRLFHEEFGDPSAPQQLPSFRGWKAAYAVRFLERKRTLERRSYPQRPLHGFSSRFPPRFPRMGGIIGGDYDIYPSFGTGPSRGGFWGPRGPFGGLHGRFRDEDMGDSWYT
eukprot:c17077_g1_i1 orf=621-2159(-)